MRRYNASLLLSTALILAPLHTNEEIAYARRIIPIAADVCDTKTIGKEEVERRSRSVDMQLRYTGV